ncbi:MAG: hypothetical protein U0174_22375 [Polyangiaceae bacterium]
MMDDPPRLFEDPETPDAVRRLLSASELRPTEPMPEGVFLRHRRRIAVMAAFPAFFAGLFKAKAAAAAVVAFAVFAAVATAAVVVREHGSSGASSQEDPGLRLVATSAGSALSGPVNPVASFTAAVETVDGLPRAPLPAPSTVRTAPQPSAASSTVQAIASETPEDLLAEEVRLLQEAKSLVRTNPAGALAKTREHGHRFPKGTLALEREMVAIEALVSSGRMQDARTHAAALRPRVQGTIYASRLETIVAPKAE